MKATAKDDATLYPDLAIPAYYEMDGAPVKIEHPLELPKRLRLGGKWESVGDPIKFRHQSMRITKEEFDQLAKSFQEWERERANGG